MRGPDKEAFAVSYVDAGAALGTLGNVVLCVLRDPISLERLRALRRETERIVARVGQQRGGITVVEASAISDVSKPVREESAALMRDFPSACSATVIEGRGFKAVAARAILSGMTLLSRARSNNRIVDTVEEAADWVAANVPRAGGDPPPTRDALLAAIARTRGAIPGKG